MSEFKQIKSWLDLDALNAEKEAFLKQIRDVVTQLKSINKVEVKLEGTQGMREAAAGMQQLTKQQAELSISVKDYQKLQDQLAASVSKLNALETEAAKQIAANKEATRQRNLELRAQAQLQNSAEGSLDQMRAKLKLLQKEYDGLSRAERNAAKGQDLLKKVQEQDRAVKELEFTSGRFGRNVGNYSGAVKVLQDALGDVKKKLDEMNASGNANAEVVAALEREYALLENVTSSQAAGFAGMRQEIKANQQAIEQLTAEYGADADIVQRLIQLNAELRDSQADLVATQRALGSDTFGLDAAVEGATALVSVYSVAQGAAALFGEENEDLQKTMMKLQAAMSIVQGLQALQNALQAESALMLGIQQVRTLAAAAAQRIYAIATAGATTAMKALNGVLLAGGLTALLVLLPMIVEAMSGFGDETDDAAESQEELTKRLEEQAEALDKVAKAQQKVRDARAGGLNDLRRELELSEARGDSDLSIYQKKKAVMDRELYDLEVLRDTQETNSEKYIEYAEAVKDKRNEMLALQLAYEKDQAGKVKKIREDQAKNAKEAAEREFKARFELYKIEQERRIAVEQSSADNESASAYQRVAARKRQMDEEITLLEATRDFELQNEKLTASERELIRVQAAHKIKEAEVQMVNDLVAIRANANEQEKARLQEAEAMVQRMQSEELEARKKGLEAINEMNVESTRQAQNAAIALELGRYTRGEIDKEEYEKRKLAIQNKYSREALLDQIAYYEQVTMLANLPADEEAAALKQLHALRQQLLDLDVKNTEDANNKKTESTKQALEAQKAAIQSLQSETIDFIGALFTGAIDRQKNALQEQMDGLEAHKAKEIESVNQSVDSEEKKAARIALINARAQTQKEQLERRQRQLDQERARFERAMEIARIIASTASGVANALSGPPPAPPNPVLAGIIAATGAVQLAKVLATPIPKYAEGIYGDEVHPGGWAWVGDGGRSELVVTPDGKLQKTPSVSTLVDLPAGAQVFPDFEKAAATFAFQNLQTGSRGPSEMERFAHEVTEELRLTRRAILNKKETHFTWNGAGLSVTTREGHQETTYLNKNLQW